MGTEQLTIPRGHASCPLAHSKTQCPCFWRGPSEVSSAEAREEDFGSFLEVFAGERRRWRENTSRSGAPTPPRSCREDQHHVVDWDLLLGIEQQQQNH